MRYASSPLWSAKGVDPRPSYPFVVSPPSYSVKCARLQEHIRTTRKKSNTPLIHPATNSILYDLHRALCHLHLLSNVFACLRHAARAPSGEVVALTLAACSPAPCPKRHTLTCTHGLMCNSAIFKKKYVEGHRAPAAHASFAALPI